MKRLVLAVGLVLSLVGLAPVWTAKWVEAQRKEALQWVSRKTDSLPACPADDSFFGFLDGHHAGSSPSLWEAACRKVDPPLGKAAILTDRAETFQQCRYNLSFQRSDLAQCWLNPAVRFLEKPSEPRSFARMTVADNQGREVVWVTTLPLAWEQNLQREHRLWLLLATSLVTAPWLLWFSRRQWSEAGLLQRSLGVADVQPPLKLERLLLSVLPSFNIPQEVDDLRESYAEKFAEGGQAKANRWFRRQLCRSLFSYLHQWSYGLFRGASVRPSTRGG
jgi:hypothetical protein